MNELSAVGPSASMAVPQAGAVLTEAIGRIDAAVARVE